MREWRYGLGYTGLWEEPVRAGFDGDTDDRRSREITCQTNVHIINYIVCIMSSERKEIISVSCDIYSFICSLRVNLMLRNPLFTFHDTIRSLEETMPH